MRASALCLAMLASWGQQGVWAQGAAPDTPVAAPAATEQAVDVLEYIVRGNTVLDARSIERAVTPFLGPKKTQKDLEGVRDALQAAYHAKGYQSVHVDVPQQEFSDGIVYLFVTETRVGRVRVVGAEHSSPLMVRDQVSALKEGTVPDFNQAQAELTTLNRGPNRQVVPLVKQGALPGTMDVDLKVDDKSPWRATVSLNNDHSADTEPLRATASIGHDNLWQLGHSISITFFGAPQNLDQASVWSGSYVAPLRGTNWTLEFSGYQSDSNVASAGGTTIIGKGSSLGLKASYAIPTSGAWWHSFSAGVDFKDSDEDLRLGATGSNVPLKYAPFTLGYTGFRQTERDQLILGLSAVSGARLFGYGSDWEDFDAKRYKATPSFLLFKADLNATHIFGGGAQLGLRFASQVTDSPLVAGEQFAAGGMNSVRGYLSAESVADVGFLGSFEVRTPPFMPAVGVLDDWRFYVFTEGAKLRLREPLPEQEYRFSLASVGVGTSLRLVEHVRARFDWAYPLRDGPQTQRHDTRFNFSLTASF